jgi:secondary thiamine-phosphate synthase enzyme
MTTCFQLYSRSTKGFCDMHDLTSDVEACVGEAGVTEGVVVVSVPGSTASVTTIEFESGALGDLADAIERMAPEELHYAHDARWGDGNGFSHVRAALLGPSVSLPIHRGRLVRGTWQQVLLVDFDNGPRERKIAVQVVGE